MPLRPSRPRRTTVALALLGGCLLGSGTAHAAGHADDPGLPNIDRRAAPAVSVPDAQRAARRGLDRALGDEGEVRSDPTSGGVALVGRTDALLTGPSSRAPAQVVLDYVREHRAAFGLDRRDLANLRLVARSVSPDGITHLRFNQVLDGILAFDSGITGHVTRDGRLVAITGSAVPGAELPSPRPPLSAGASLGRARTAIRTAGLPPRTTAVRPGPSRRTTFATGEQAVLRWSPTADGPRLAWSVIADGADGHRYDVLVDAESGSTLRRQDLTSSLGEARYFPADPDTTPRWLDPESPSAPGIPYAVLTMPPSWYDDHADGTRLWGQFARTYLDPTDADPAPGSEGHPSLVQIPASGGAPSNPDWLFTQSTDFPGAGPCPPSGCTWNSDDPESADVNAAQAATNAHVLVSRFHDHLQAPPIGFDEASGNFQRTNTSGLGLGNDYVRVEVNDGEGRNNANMATPPDGTAPRMQMYLWDRVRDVNGSDEAAIVYHEYAHGLSNRLVVNASGGSMLSSFQSLMMGEAISDFYALDLLVHEGHVTDTAAPGEVRMGTYAAGPGGIRAKPIDCPVDPAGGTTACNGNGTATTVLGGYTYGDIRYTLNVVNTNQFTPHNGGEVWAQTLWEIRSALGREKALELITGGMRLVGNAPTMLDMRDAILRQSVAMRADPDVPDADYATLWEIFRARGMGRDASASNELQPTESFAAPTGVVAGTPLVSDPYPGGDNDGVIEAGETVALYLPLTGIGISPLTGVTGLLSSSSPDVTLRKFMASWPELSLGRTASNVSPFTVTLPATCAAEDVFPFAITVTSPEGGTTATGRIDPRPGTTEPVPLLDATGEPPSGDDPGSIVAQTTIAEFVVEGSGTIDADQLEVRIDELRHSWLGDLTVELVHPDGTSATLFTDLGDGNYNGRGLSQVTFRTGSPNVLPDAGAVSGGYPPLTGSFRPQSPDALSAFDGKPIAGTWQLRITDAYPGDTGVLERWGFNRQAGSASIPCGRLEIPQATTAVPTVDGPTAATLNGSVTPNGRPTGVRFVYGPTASYGAVTPTVDVGSGDTSVGHSAPITGLAPGTTYHYRVETIRENGQVAVVGDDRTFTTAADPDADPGLDPDPDPGTTPDGGTGTPPTAGPPPAPPADPLPPLEPFVPPAPFAPVTPTPTTPVDTDAPRFLGRVTVRQSVVRRRSPLRRRASFRVRLSEPGRVTATVTRSAPGVRKGRRCVAAPKRTRPTGRRCTRTVTVTSAAVTVRRASASTTLRLGSSGLPRGSYRVSLVAIDGSGNRSVPHTLRLRIR